MKTEIKSSVQSDSTTYKKNRCESDRIVLKVCQSAVDMKSWYEKSADVLLEANNKLQLVWKEQKLWCDKGGKTKRSGLWQYIYISCGTGD